MIPEPRRSRNERQIVSVKGSDVSRDRVRGKHKGAAQAATVSAKPAEVRSAIERMFPDPARRLEMFARAGGSLSGWDVWGFDAENVSP